MFAGFGLNDVLDILLMSILIYYLYKLLIGSRAWNVVRGIVFLGLAWFLAAQLSLPTTGWLFENAAGAALLGIVLVFQPELRGALERVGRFGSKHSNSGDPVQELVAAIRELASENRGALISIQRRDPLDEYGKIGSTLNSPVSAALLQTIFGSKGPLHDGGVIIKDDMIKYAGAIFPTSDRRDGVPINHGTRHRAALGLSEVTDAITIVVSEERGTVSVAQQGTIKSDVAPADVIKALREIYRT